MTPETPDTPEDEKTTPEAPAPEAPPAEEPQPPAEAPPAEEPAPVTPAAEPEAPVAPPVARAEPVPQLEPKERKAASRARRGLRRGATPEERSEIRAQKAVARRRRRQQEKAKRGSAARPAGEGTPVADRPAGTPQVRTGRVVSDKADKTITVRIDIARRHRRYRKIVRSSMTLHAHDEANDANAGDYVRVVEARPMSRTKRWRLAEVLERAK